MADTSNLDVFKESINEIQENAEDQRSILPELKEQHDSLDEELRTVFSNLKTLRNQELLIKIETDVLNVKLRQLEVQEYKQRGELDKVQREGALYQHLLGSERENIEAQLGKHEEALKMLAQTFRSAPLFYEVSTLGREVDAMERSSVELSAELQEVQKEVVCAKQKYNLHTEQGRTRPDLAALTTVMSDSVVVRNILDTISRTEEEYLKTSKLRKHELQQAQAAKLALQS